MLPFETEKNIAFIHAGANDGVSNDWIFKSATQNDWKGVCLEPQPDSYKKLCLAYENYPNITPLCGALASEKGEFPLHSFSSPDPEFFDVFDKLSSFDLDLLVKNVEVELSSRPELKKRVGNILKRVRSQMVRCYTTEELLRDFISNPDLISLDIEGYEAKIIEGFPFEKIKPKYIFFEAFHMHPDEKSKCLNRLSLEGYSFVGAKEYGIEDFNILAVRT